MKVNLQTNWKVSGTFVDWKLHQSTRDNNVHMGELSSSSIISSKIRMLNFLSIDRYVSLERPPYTCTWKSPLVFAEYLRRVIASFTDFSTMKDFSSQHGKLIQQIHAFCWLV